MLEIKKASKKDSKLRLNIVGVSGGGKTYTSLAIGSELGQKLLVVDTEHGSASKYADIFNFDVVELDNFPPERFIEAIKLAEANQYDVIILDSLSHAWMGKGGILEIHSEEEKKVKNSYTAWNKVTPRHNALIEAIVQSKVHVIATMRAKTEHAIKQENGKTKVERLGMAPVQRDGMEFEFDVVAEINIENDFIVQKSRCPALSGKVFNRAGLNVAEILKSWLQGEKETRTVVRPVQPVETPLEIFKPSETVEPMDGLAPRLVKKIRQVLSDLNKPEAAFNTWYQNEYGSSLNWDQSSVAVLRELESKVTGWLNNARSKTNSLKDTLMERDELNYKIEQFLKDLNKPEEAFVDWVKGYFQIEAIGDWRTLSADLKRQILKVLEEMKQKAMQRQAA
jgi:hypothetical protein